MATKTKIFFSFLCMLRIPYFQPLERSLIAPSTSDPGAKIHEVYTEEDVFVNLEHCDYRVFLVKLRVIRELISDNQRYYARRSTGVPQTFHVDRQRCPPNSVLCCYVSELVN